MARPFWVSDKRVHLYRAFISTFYAFRSFVEHELKD